MGAPLLSIRRNKTPTKTSVNNSTTSLTQSAEPASTSSSMTMKSWRRTLSLTSSKNTTTTNNDSETTTLSLSKRSMRLSISPDTESESMQVNLMEGNSPIKTSNKVIIKSDSDCLYTVGSSEYLVRDDNNNNDEISINADNTKQIINDGGEDNAAKTSRSASLEAIAGGDGGGNEKKKSRMGSIFKKSGKKGGGGGGGDKEEQGGSNNNNNNNNDKNDGDQNGQEKNEDDNAGDKKDDDDDDDDKETNKNNIERRFSSAVSFTNDRIQFASESTLPLHAGSESTAPTDTPSWTPVSGTEFKVRVGPNYPKTGKKENSCPSLYEVYCVRYFRSGKRTVGGATRIMPLPGMMDDMGSSRSSMNNVCNTEDNGADDTATKSEEGEEEDGDGDIKGTSAANDTSVCGGKHHPELNGTKVPDVLVVHFMLPYEPPNMFKQKDDGPGGECVYYLKPSQRFLDEVSGRVPPTPATTLFVKWCAECESDFKMRSRFKCMALVRDIDKHNFGLLKSYNGKPVLITESGRVASGYHGDVRYLEMTANGKFDLCASSCLLPLIVFYMLDMTQT